MTDTTRERMAEAIAKNAEGQAQAYGVSTPYADAIDREGDAILDGRFDLYQFVDTVLSVLETPSPAALQAFLSVECDNPAAHTRFTAMVKAIRSGA